VPWEWERERDAFEKNDSQENKFPAGEIARAEGVQEIGGEEVKRGEKKKKKFVRFIRTRPCYNGGNGNQVC